MGYSVLDVAQTTRKQALQGMEDAANQESQREAANKQLKEAKQAQTMSNIGTGAGVGYMIGAGAAAAGGAASGAASGAAAGSVAGPMGAAIGAGIGLIASLF